MVKREQGSYDLWALCSIFSDGVPGVQALEIPWVWIQH